MYGMKVKALSASILRSNILVSTEGGRYVEATIEVGGIQHDVSYPLSPAERQKIVDVLTSSEGYRFFLRLLAP